MRSLPVGAYKVTAEIFGFKSFILNGIDLAVAQEVVLNLTLEVGTTAERVTVTGEAPLVELRYSESVKSARSSLARFARPNWPGSATSIFRDDVRCDRLSNMPGRAP